MDRPKLSHLTAYVLIALLLVAVLGIIAMEGAGERVLQENYQLQEQIQELEQENLEYEYRINTLGTDEAVEQLARERLHWVYDQEIVYVDSGDH